MAKTQPRREFLTGACAVGLAALAGCIDGNGSNGEENYDTTNAEDVAAGLTVGALDANEYLHLDADVSISDNTSDLPDSSEIEVETIETYETGEEYKEEFEDFFVEHGTVIEIINEDGPGERIDVSVDTGDESYTQHYILVPDGEEWNVAIVLESFE